MKRFVLIAALAALALPFAAPLARAQVTTWAPDKAHSEVDFSILHMSLSKVRGRFGLAGGTINFDEKDISKSTVNITIDVASIDTGVAARDNDLKSPTFFDTTKFPTATFVSTSVAKAADGLTVTGNLTLHGVTRPVTLHVEGPTGPVNGMDHKPHMGFSATATVKRTDFDIASKFPAAVVGDDVNLIIDLDVAKQ